MQPGLRSARLPAKLRDPVEDSWGVVRLAEDDLAEFAHQVDGAGGDDDAIGRSQTAAGGQRIKDRGRCLRRNVEGAGGGEKVVERNGAGVVDGSEEDVVLRAVSTGVEEG